MLVPEVIQHAVAGNMNFNFIETTITASVAGTLSTQKGKGHAHPDDGHFNYKFIPRGPLQHDWLKTGGYLAAMRKDVRFCIKGTERNSARWAARTDSLRLVRNGSGFVVRGVVKEWCSVDSRAVSSSFMRAIVPGKHLYPAKTSPAGGANARSASVRVDEIQVEFRDYGNYTEIFAQDNGRLPGGLADKVVDALAGVLGRRMELVYKEEHVGDRRHVCVRQAPFDNGHHQASQDRLVTGDYAKFWEHYSERLSALCQAPSDECEDSGEAGHSRY